MVKANKQMAKDFMKLFYSLTRRQRQVLDLRYEAGMTQTEVANQLALTRQRIFQTENRALSIILSGIEQAYNQRKVSDVV